MIKKGNDFGLISKKLNTSLINYLFDLSTLYLLNKFILIKIKKFI